MRAVVLVGGFGKRLRPLTYAVPKPMLPIGHVPMIVRLIDRLERGGVDRVTLALGFKPEPFQQAFPDGRCGAVHIDYAIEPEPLDTAGAIRFAADTAGIDDTFVVANGDILTDLAVGDLVEFHRRRGAEVTVHASAVADPSVYGVAEIDDDGLVRRFVEKPPPGTEPSNLINAGTYVVEPAMLERIAPGRPCSIERETFPAVVADNGVYAMPTDDYWIDTGRPDEYLQANLDVLNGVRRDDHADPVEQGANVDHTADVASSLVGAGAAVAPNAKIIESVVLPGARIGPGARISRSIVMGAVGADAMLERCVVGAEGRVGDGERLTDVRRPDPDVPAAQPT